MLGKNSFGVSL